MSNRIRGRRSYKRCKMKVVPNQDLMSEHRENGPIVRELPVEPEQFGKIPRYKPLSSKHRLKTGG